MGSMLNSVLRTSIVSGSLAQNPGGKALRVFFCQEFAEIVEARRMVWNVAASVYQQIDSKLDRSSI